jgi:hypothetical protein
LIFLLYALSDLELSNMTLRNLGPQALVLKNICYEQHQFLMRGLGDMSSDGQTDGRMDSKTDRKTDDEQSEKLT